MNQKKGSDEWLKLIFDNCDMLSDCHEQVLKVLGTRRAET